MTPKQFTKITDWQEKTFPHSTAKSKLFHLRKEVDELIEAITTDESDEDIEHEFADCFILLFGAARCHGLEYADIVLAIDKKDAINATREWNKPDADGVVTHKKENED